MRSILRAIIVRILILEARLVLRKYKPKIVAVTGSVGKTSTKDAIYATLSGMYHVRKSEKSFNSEIGVPLTILGLPNAWSSALGWVENIIEGAHVLFTRAKYPEWLVLEVGADKPGDIKRMAWLKPHVAVYTRFPDVPVHVEFFDSPEQVIVEKMELGKALRPTGTLVVNADDEKMKNIEVSEGQHLLSFGTDASATVRGGSTENWYEDGVLRGISFSVTFQNEKNIVRLPGVIGTHHIQPVLAGITVAISEGMSFAHAVEQAGTYTPPPGRMRIVPGKEGLTLIDDTYNASPVAVMAGLDAIDTLSVSGKKIVVLGDMMELGEYSVAEHEHVGKRAAAVADIFVAVGVRMRGAADAATKLQARCKDVISVQDAQEALRELEKKVQQGDCVYVKGSQSMRMERVVKGLMAEPERAPDLLVRQDAEWQKR